MTAFLSVNGLLGGRAKFCIPFYGNWVADIWMLDGSALPSSVNIQLGNLAASGFVYRSSSYGGTRRMRVMGGGGGWRSTIPPQQYSQPSGVLLSTVLGDAAQLVGEKVDVIQDATLGAFYVREQAPAQRVLRLLAGPEWWVGLQGTTNVGQRASPTISSPFIIQKLDGSNGALDIATEDYASWIPGAIFSNDQHPTPAQVGYSQIETDEDGVARVRVLTVGVQND